MPNPLNEKLKVTDGRMENQEIQNPAPEPEPELELEHSSQLD